MTAWGTRLWMGTLQPPAQSGERRQLVTLWHPRALHTRQRKIIATLLMIGLVTVASAAETQVILTVGSVTAPPGGIAPITMSFAGGNGDIEAMGFDVFFDPSAVSIEPRDCVIAEALASSHILAAFVPVPGQLRLGVFQVPPVGALSDGELATCTFRVPPTAPLGPSPLTAENIQPVGFSAPPLALPAGPPQNGVVGVELPTPTATVSATRASTPTNAPTSPPTSTPTAAPTNTPAYTATPTTKPSSTPTSTPTAVPTNTATPTPTAILCVGDCGGDGSVTVDELSTMVNLALGDGGTCPHGIAPGTIPDVTLTLQAVSNALNGCPPTQ